MYSAAGFQRFKLFSAIKRIEWRDDEDFVTMEAIQGGTGPRMMDFGKAAQDNPKSDELYSGNEEPMFSPWDNNVETEDRKMGEQANNQSNDSQASQSTTCYEEQEMTADNDQAELLKWHYRLGHVSFKKLKILAMLGLIPRKLAKVRTPKCMCCIYGTMTRVPWKNKGQENKRSLVTASKSVQCVSVDQLESRQAGFAAQLKGKLTNRRYTAATVFVDHYSRFSYIHLQSSLSSKETLQAKLAFEAYAKKLGVKIQHYHADNGRFADNDFLQDVERKGQTISYCGVNAHW